jgi:undecaprenyl diphosphate synthase
MIQDVHKSNPVQPEQHVWLAASYGGRAEIVAGVNKLLKDGAKEVSEDDVANALWTKGMPDPDVIVRTGGEKRLSGFLTWSSVYAELFFPDVYWPAFTKDDFDAILSEYAERDRRHGK